MKRFRLQTRKGNGLASSLCPAGEQPELLRHRKQQSFNPAILDLVNDFPASIPTTKGPNRGDTVKLEKPLLSICIFKISDVTI